MENAIFDENKDPIFEITTLETGKHIKIYLDGRVEGFGEEISIFNLIPSVWNGKAVRAKHDILLAASKSLAKIITDDGWKIETFYSDVESKSFNSSGEQDETLYSVKETFFSSASLEEK